MRNYVIINGINSNTIQGLAINILPPITKPMMRSQIEEIDGRDGDLVTELGYSAYDKSMEIGLWGTYDIDAIIKYFTGDGTIVFSTEPDKYYYFKILNQIDYEKLLKFKKATVTFHCQPFKYPTSETPLEEAYEYVEDTGTDLTLNNTEETIFNKFDLIGNTYQDSTTGKNILKYPYRDTTKTTNGITFTDLGDGTIKVNGTATANAYFYLPAMNDTYYKNMNGQTLRLTGCPSGGSNSTYRLIFCNDSWLGGIDTGNGSNFVVQDTYYNQSFIQIYNGTTINNLIFKPMLSKDTSISYNSYEPYTGGIPAPNPDYPQDIHVVSGDNEIEICGKNLFDGIWESGTINNTTGQEQSGNNVRRTKNYIKIQPNTTYTISRTTTPTNTMPLRYYNSSKAFIGSAVGITASNHVTITTPNNAYYVRFVDFENNNAQIMLEKGDQATTYEEFKDASYPINLPVENLFDYSSNIIDNANFGSGSIVADNSCTLSYCECKPNTTYTISRRSPMTQRFMVATTQTIPSVGVSLANVKQFYDDTTTSITLTTGANDKYIVTRFVYNKSDDYETYAKTIQIEKGNKVNSYTSFGTTPIEMCSIQNTDYKDTLVHEDNKWYKYAMVGKVVLNDSENWQTWSYGTNSWRLVNKIYPKVVDSDPLIMNTKFKGIAKNDRNTDNSVIYVDGSNVFTIRNTPYTTQAQAQSGMSGEPIYYVLENPTQTEITDETLKAQLDDLWENAISYKGQTNITQTNNDMPFILDVSALKDGSDHLIIDNIGTAYSKPTIDIEGTGIIDIYLNDEQIFEIDLTTQNEIIIDTEKMEAYTPDNTLANRLVTGDYSNFKLAPGENDLRFSGDLTKATVTRYIRWI